MPDQELKPRKAVLISIQPRWCELIASGKKTVEVRKTAPKLETPFKCYIYQTKLKWVFSFLRMWGMDNLADKLTAAFGYVVGEFVCDDCSLLTKAHYAYIEKHGYISRIKLKAYMGIENGRELSYSDGCYGWHISDLVIYDEPKELSNFIKPYGTIIKAFDSPYIQRAPQSWCYVQEV